jgi:CRISPR/Cas system-associated exonuclease Cas4 (RecB family)
VGMCARRNVYEYTRTPCLQTIDPDSLEIFDLGHAIHELVQRKLEDVARVLRPKNMGFSISREATYDETTDSLLVDFGIGGTCDGVMEVWADDWRQRSVLEAKSKNSKQFSRLGKAPPEDHLLQAHIYAYRFNAPIIYIWCYCKDNSQTKVYPEVFDPDVLRVALKRFEEQLRHAEAGTLPEREEDWYACPRCEYRNTCQPAIISQIRSQKTSAALSTIRKRGRL